MTPTHRPAKAPNQIHDITLSGVIGASGTNALRDLLTFEQPPSVLRISMAEVVSIDVPGLKVLFGAAASYPIILIHPPTAVRQLIELTGLRGLIVMGGDPL